MASAFIRLSFLRTVTSEIVVDAGKIAELMRTKSRVLAVAKPTETATATVTIPVAHGHHRRITGFDQHAPMGTRYANRQWRLR